MRIFLIAPLLLATVISCGPASSSLPLSAPLLFTAPAPLPETPDHGTPTSTAAEAATLYAAAAEAVSVSAVVAAPIPMAVPTGANIPTPHIWQTLNNCGPASVVMALAALGIASDQESARLVLRGEDVRRGMGPTGVDSFVTPLGAKALWRVGGSTTLLQKLVAAGFTPLVTQWLDTPSVSRIAHWRVIHGYDQASSLFYSADPMKGGNVAFTASELGELWVPFGYRYLVVYRPEDETKLAAVLGADYDEAGARTRMYERAVKEAADRNDPFYDFGLGQAAYDTGHYTQALAAFEAGFKKDSGAGVYTMRSTYPNTLLRLGRLADAQAAATQMNRQ